MSKEPLPIKASADNKQLLTNIAPLYMVFHTPHVLKSGMYLYCIPFMIFTQNEELAHEIFSKLSKDEFDLLSTTDIYYIDKIFYASIPYDENTIIVNKALDEVIKSEDIEPKSTDEIELTSFDTDYVALITYTEPDQVICNIEALPLTADISMSMMMQVANWTNITAKTGQQAYERVTDVFRLIGFERDSLFLEILIAQTFVCENDETKLWRNTNCPTGKLLSLKQAIRTLHPVRQFFFENMKNTLPMILVYRQEQLTDFDKYLFKPTSF